MVAKNTKLLNLMLLLSILGLIITSYQTIEHYFLDEGVCDFSENISCGHITSSRYGEFPFESGIATALWGIPWWILLIFLLSRMKSKKPLKNQEFYSFLLLVVGLVFVFYLLLVEFYLLPKETEILVICPFCTVQHILIISLFIMSFKFLKKPLSLYIKDFLYK